MRRSFRRLAPLLAIVALALSGCESLGLPPHGGPQSAPPVPDRTATSAAALADYLEMLQRLVESPPAVQAEIYTTAQREFELAPTPGHQLRFALVLATADHAATDLIRARDLLRELLATPQTLGPPERALAFLELQKAEQHLLLTAENKRLTSMGNNRDEREKLAALTKRLQTETEENARLRKELDEAQAKLDAIANIESTLNQRKPNSEGHPP